MKESRDKLLTAHGLLVSMCVCNRLNHLKEYSFARIYGWIWIAYDTLQGCSVFSPLTVLLYFCISVRI